MDAVEYKRQKDDGYRAIGRYIVAFSQLMSHMRYVIASRIAWRHDDDPALVEMILGEAMPKLITDSFFGLCRVVGQFDEAEKKVERKLRNDAVEICNMRNDIAHGDWWVGQMERYDSPTVRAPALVRIKPGRVDELPEQTVDLLIADLDTMADDISALTNTLAEFGRLALGLPIVTHEPIPPSESRVTREFRVRDIYVLRGTKKAPQGPRVVRDGPKAELVPLSHWVGDVVENELIEEISG
jgi:hypothetical protein